MEKETSKQQALWLILMVLTLLSWAVPNVSDQVIHWESRGLIEAVGRSRALALGASVDQTTHALLDSGLGPIDFNNGLVKGLRELVLRGQLLLLFAPLTVSLALGFLVETRALKRGLADPSVWRPSLHYRRVHQRSRILQGLALMSLLAPIPLPPPLLLGLMSLLFHTLSQNAIEDRLSDPIVSL